MKIGLVIAFVVSLGLNGWFLYQTQSRDRVLRVVDGDSFDLADHRRIRLLGLDAPEKERCHFQESYEALKSLVDQKQVRLTDVVTDDYGRILANVYVGDTFVNGALVQSGAARYTSVNSAQKDFLKRAQETAKTEKRGIYADVCRGTSVDPDCQIKGNTRAGEKWYFLPTCKNYDQVVVDQSFGDQWFCTEAEARKSGFTKVSNCQDE